MGLEFDRFHDLERKLNETIDRELGQLEDVLLGDLFFENEEIPAPVVKKGPGRPKGVKESKPRKVKSNILEEILERTLNAILHLSLLDIK